MLLIPLYQTITTFVYQFEYILHNLNCIVNQDNTMYNNFINDFNKELQYNNKYSSNDIIDYNLTYNNKKTLYINTLLNLLITNSYRRYSK